MKLRHALLACTAILALSAGSVAAAELPYPIDGDSKFNWKSYHDFADKHDLKGQTLSIFGPWLTGDKDGFEKVLAYFQEATGRHPPELRLRLVRAADRHRHPGGQPGQHRHLPAARPRRRRRRRRAYRSPLGDATQKWLVDNYAAGQSWVDLSTYTARTARRSSSSSRGRRT